MTLRSGLVMPRRTCTLLTSLSSTMMAPSRSRMRPRTAGSVMTRMRLARVSAAKLSDVATWRNQRRANRAEEERDDDDADHAESYPAAAFGHESITNDVIDGSMGADMSEGRSLGVAPG